MARKIMISTTRTDNFAEAAISDAGPGIPSDKIKEVFEPFFTTKQSGMGMGLSIARTIVEAHDGLIWAENLPSGGTSIRIKLPLAT
jgi:signal transduction histidine kinase